MNVRFLLGGLLCVCAQATLTASNVYDFGTISGVSLADEIPIYVAGSFTQNNDPSSLVTIDCVVSSSITSTTQACGSGAAANVPVTPPGAGTLPACSSNCNFLMVDGSPAYGAPVSVDLTGLVSGQSYTLSFYQASTQELRGNTGAYDDSWLVYLLSSTHTTGTYICPQAYCTTYTAVTPAPAGSTLLGQTTVMQNPSAGSTAWEQITYTFTAAFTGSQVLEFVTNVASSSNTALPSGTVFMPPMLALDDVTLTHNGGTSTPEPGTWGLTIMGAGLIFGAGKLRHRIAARS